MSPVSGFWQVGSYTSLFEAVGPDQHLDSIKATVSDKYKIKIEQVGHGDGKNAEIRILNKVVRMTEARIELEADPRHAELVIKEEFLTWLYNKLSGSCVPPSGFIVPGPPIAIILA